MSAALFEAINRDHLSTIELGPSPSPSRTITGTPTASELILHEDATTEIGIWEITPGSFHSTKIGIAEYMYFLSGAGTITRQDGEVVTISPDSYISLPDGSEVVWDVTETSRKFYVITQSTPVPAS